MDAIVYTDLNPTEDYKSSVLAALKPDVILDIASRALSFWTYQQTQEYAYLQLTYRQLEERNGEVERRMSSLAREANQEIAQLRERISSFEKEHELEKRRSLDVAEQLQEKTRQLHRLQVIARLRAGAFNVDVPFLANRKSTMPSKGKPCFNNQALLKNLSLPCFLPTPIAPLVAPAASQCWATRTSDLQTVTRCNGRCRCKDNFSNGDRVPVPATMAMVTARGI